MNFCKYSNDVMMFFYKKKIKTILFITVVAESVKLAMNDPPVI